MLFRHRAQAGRRLAERLVHLKGDGAIFLGLPRGMPVAFRVALALRAPMGRSGHAHRGCLFLGQLGERRATGPADRVR